MRWGCKTVVASLDFLPGNRCYAVGVTQPEGTRSPAELRVWDVLAGEAITPSLEHHGRLACAALSPSGRRLAIVTVEKSSRPSWLAQVWELDSVSIISQWGPRGDAADQGETTSQRPHRSALPKRVLFTGDDARVLMVTGAEPFGQPEASSSEATIWGVSDGRLTARLRHQGPVTCVDCNSKGDRILTGSSDRTVRLWNAATGEPATAPLPHNDVVYHAAFSPGGRMVVTASADGTARVWDAASGEPITPALPHGAQVLHASFSADATRVATACLDGLVRVWNLSVDPRPIPHLVKLSGLLAGHGIDATGGYNAWERQQSAECWEELGKQCPAEFSCSEDDAAAWHARQADAAESAANWHAVILHLNQLRRYRPDMIQLHTRRGAAFAQLGKWSEAGQEYAKALHEGNDDAELQRKYALLLLQLGKQEEYRNRCAAIAVSSGESADSLATVIRTCVLGPNALANFEPLLNRSDNVAADGARRVSRVTVLRAALLYRCGRCEEAVEAFNQSERQVPWELTAWRWLFLSMAHRQLGNSAEADTFLQQAAEWLDKWESEEVPSPRTARLDWSERLELDLLRREASQE